MKQGMPRPDVNTTHLSIEYSLVPREELRIQSTHTNVYTGYNRMRGQ